VDTSESVLVAAEDLNEVVLFQLGEGVRAGSGIYEVLTDPFKVGYINSFEDTGAPVRHVF